MSDLRYPIGKFTFDGSSTETDRQKFIDDIEQTPAKLGAAVQGLSQEKLNTPYRPGGWTVRQVVHHLPDSHLNSYVRFKLALTEEEPTIKPYYEDRWAELQEAKTAPIELSLALLDSLHKRSHLPSSRSRRCQSGKERGALFMAWAAPRSSYHLAAGENGLVRIADCRFLDHGLSFDEYRPPVGRCAWTSSKTVHIAVAHVPL